MKQVTMIPQKHHQPSDHYDVFTLMITNDQHLLLAMLLQLLSRPRRARTGTPQRPAAWGGCHRKGC